VVEQLLARGQPLDHNAKGPVGPKREDLTRKSWSRECTGVASPFRAGANVANCSHSAWTGAATRVRKERCSLFVEDVDLNARACWLSWVNDLRFPGSDVRLPAEVTDREEEPTEPPGGDDQDVGPAEARTEET